MTSSSTQPTAPEASATESARSLFSKGMHSLVSRGLAPTARQTAATTRSIARRWWRERGQRAGQWLAPGISSPGEAPKPSARAATVADAVVPYLRKSGWMRSREVGRPVDAHGNPLAWYTYSAIHFLQGRITEHMTVFEFGCGYSTLWWASRVAHVTSVEHHPGWFEIVRQQVPPNCELLHAELEADGAYSRSAIDARGGPFSIIVVDGRDRVNCAQHSLASLRDDGVIVWDNTDRARYQAGFKLLEAAGFRRLDFRGHGPISAREWMTSVFYRHDNCLGI